MLEKALKLLRKPHETNFLSLRQCVIYAVIAVATFHIAYTIPQCSFLIAIYLYCLFRLAWVKKAPLALYLGLIVGLSIIVPHFFFFWTIFGPQAIAFWFIGAIWFALFLLLCRMSLKKLNRIVAVLLIPFIWTGCDYFRSELYYFRSSWLIPGYAFSHNPQNLFLSYIGIYGVAFFIMLAIALLTLPATKKALIAKVLLLLLLAVAVNVRTTAKNNTSGNHSPLLVGIQAEPVVAKKPSSLGEIISYLNQAIEKHPDADIILLSECIFSAEPPDEILSWCKEKQRYLIVGGFSRISSEDDQSKYNSAFVVSPDGQIIFRQDKSVPVQFVEDSKPAKEQKLWDSPWGKIGICICWDMSFTRVTDKLVQMGAQGFIVPCGDVWGSHQTYLHSKVAPIRAAEHSLPIFRASNNMSQLASHTGEVLASGLYGRTGSIIAGRLALREKGSVPIDRVIAPLSTLLTVIVILSVLLLSILTKHRDLSSPDLQNKET